jgi:uncharacterized protein YggU (UPF0235/DUF167 family)
MTFRLQIHAVPNAKVSQFAGRHGEALRLKLAAPPEDGRANRLATELIAEAFGLPKSSVRLVRGASSRSKHFELQGLEESRANLILEKLSR